MEHVDTAPNLARRGVGDTIALVRRDGVPLSTATREIVTLARSLLPGELS